MLFRIVWILTLSFLYPQLNAEPDLTVLIPMRDGVELPADVYFPKNVPIGQAPCVLIRNPSGKRAKPWLTHVSLKESGYVVVVQDARNCNGKEKNLIPYYTDAWGELQDGYDTVEWLAKSPLTNGEIGTIGFSAAGITQLLLAPTAPPSLRCQYIGVAASDLYSQAIFNNGQLLKHQVEGWLKLYGDNTELLAFIAGQREYNSFWERFNTDSVAYRVNVPGLHYGGWYDIFINGTINAFASRQYDGGLGAKGRQKLLIGPWTHHWPENVQLGDFEIPVAGRRPPYDYSPEVWFNHYLKKHLTSVDEIPAVTYFVMGPFDGSYSSGNRWKTSEVWPIPAEATPLHLVADGKLVWPLPETVGIKRFVYDPMDPVPTVGGRNLFLESGPKDQRAIENRDDVVVFTSAPLDRELEVTGTIIAKLFFGTDRDDTDVVVRLTDVYPDGRSILISDGIYRLRHGHDGDLSLPQEVTLDLHPTSIVFATGHSIRVSISSSNYPRCEKNPNCLNPEAEGVAHYVATNRLWMGGDTPSRLILPVVRR